MKWPGLVTLIKFPFRKLKIFALKLALYIISGTGNSLVVLFGSFFTKGNLFKRLVFSGIIAGFVIFACVTSYALYVWNQDIDISKLKEYSPVISSTIFDKNGSNIAEFAKERRIFVPIDKISKHIINAFISAEDRSFYTNPGIDIKGLARVMIMDGIYFLQGKKLHGASTITQQVVRSTLLTNERTVTRKIKEMILSYKISKIMTKNEIMEVYLNHIYLGSKSYGVEAATQEYFNKNALEVTIPEAALIASLTKSPSTLDPRKGRVQTFERRKWVIKSMFEEGYISEEDFKASIAENISLADKKSIQRPYSYIEYVASYLAENKQISMEDLQSNGYEIKTKYDYNIHKAAYKALNDGIVNYDKRHGYKGALSKCENTAQYKDCLIKTDIPEKLGRYVLAVVLDVSEEKAIIGFEKNDKAELLLDGVRWAKKRLEDLEVGAEIKKVSEVLSVGDVIIVDKNDDNDYTLAQIPEVDGAAVVVNPKDGSIVAMIGGYLDLPGTFNRAFQAKRQPGSVAKIFSYLTILENGFQPTDLVVDSDVEISSGDGISWNPQNDTKTHYGAITVRRAFEKSLNAPLARLMYEVGASKLSLNLEKLGVAHNVEPVLSSALGSFDATLVDVIRGYSAIINGGKKVEITPITSIKISEFAKNESNPDATPADIIAKIEQEEEVEEITMSDVLANTDQLINAGIAYQLTSMLQGCAIRGTAAKFGKISPNLFGKTGTTNDAKDLWFVGGSGDYIVGVYVGYDAPKSLGKKEYGGVTALPIAAEIMSEIVKNYPAKPFSPPAEIKMVNVNLETGKITKSGGIPEALRKTSQIDLRAEDNSDISESQGDINSGVY